MMDLYGIFFLTFVVGITYVGYMICQGIQASEHKKRTDAAKKEIERLMIIFPDMASQDPEKRKLAYETAKAHIEIEHKQQQGFQYINQNLVGAAILFELARSRNNR